MPLVTGVAFLMWGGLPGIDRPNFAAMTGSTRRATLRLSMHRMAARALRMIAAPSTNGVVTVTAYQLRSSGRTMPLMAFATSITMRPELRRPMAVATNVVVRGELMRQMAGFTGFMRRGRGFCNKLALFAMTTATAHRSERRGMGCMARRTDTVLRCLCLGNRLENRLMTIGADLGLVLVFVRFVAGGAFFVTVTTLRHVATGASCCRRLAGMAAVAIHAVGVRGGIPSRQRGLNWRMALDATRSFRPECMCRVATRAALMLSC